jgi:hypothetical protein
MDRRWLGIRVDLSEGRGQMLDPQPGRRFAVPPSCTFDEFGRAIDLAFVRWVMSHLRQFTLEDGILVVDEEMADELGASAFGGGAIPRTLLLSPRSAGTCELTQVSAMSSTSATIGRTPARSRARSIRLRFLVAFPTGLWRTRAGAQSRISMGDARRPRTAYRSRWHLALAQRMALAVYA